MAFIILIFHSIILCSILILILNYKFKVGLKHLFTDNIIIAIGSTIISSLFNQSYIDNLLYTLLLNTMLVPILLVLNIMIRIYRVPNRKAEASINDIISPADGNVVYIKRYEVSQLKSSPYSSIHLSFSDIKEVNLFQNHFWVIGINPTLFDVHKYAAAISGNIVLNKYFVEQSDIDNTNQEIKKHITLIDSGRIQIGIIQILPRNARHFFKYFKENDYVKRGEWIGVIRIGSIMEILIPSKYSIELNIKDQVYAGKTIIAKDTMNV